MSLKPGLSKVFFDHCAPLSAVTASGENVSFWLGRKPVTSDVGPVAAITRPPLLATPAGVASFQPVEPAGRTNSSQKLSSDSGGPRRAARSHGGARSGLSSCRAFGESSAQPG